MNLFLNMPNYRAIRDDLVFPDANFIESVSLVCHLHHVGIIQHVEKLRQV